MEDRVASFYKVKASMEGYVSIKTPCQHCTGERDGCLAGPPAGAAERMEGQIIVSTGYPEF
jgi:Fe-S-cluster-containing hydrogenase component 2